jgi:hypothetical protein
VIGALTPFGLLPLGLLPGGADISAELSTGFQHDAFQGDAFQIYGGTDEGGPAPTLSVNPVRRGGLVGPGGLAGIGGGLVAMRAD